MSGPRTSSNGDRGKPGVSGSHRRSGSRNWTSGSVAGTGHSNGSRKSNSSTPENRQSGDDADSVAKHMEDRLLYALVKSIGSKATVTIGSGTRYAGLLYSTSGLDSSGVSVVLKYPKVEYLAPGEERETLPESLVILSNDIMSFEVDEVNLEKSDTTVSSSEESLTKERSAGFKTDTDISGFKPTEERELERWVPEEGDKLTFGGLEENSHSSKWDQFEVNKKKFGIDSTFDENLYTTRINTDAPDYKERLREAERLAKEIEGQAHDGNIHLAEERGLVVDDSGMDEEDKYSGVDRNGGDALMDILKSNSKNSTPSQLKPIVQGKYVTPKQRAANFHNDPAIISSSAVEPAKVSTSIPSKPQVAQKTARTQTPGGPSHFSTEAMRINAQSEINSLKEFAANFKVPQKFPPDLLPILSKDKVKQDEILKKVEATKGDEKAAATNVKKIAETPNDVSPAARSVSPSTKPVVKKKLDIKNVTPFKMNPSSMSFSPMASYKESSRNSPASQPSTPSVRPKKHGTSQSFFGSKVPTKSSNTGEILVSSFNVLLTAKKNAKNGTAIVAVEKPFVTPPTWHTTVDESYTKAFSVVQERVVGSQARQFYGVPPPIMPQTMGSASPTGMPPMMPHMMQMMPQPVFDDRQQRFFPHMQPGQFIPGAQPGFIPVQGGVSPTGQAVPMPGMPMSYSPVPGVIPMMNTRPGSKQAHGYNGYYSHSSSRSNNRY